MASNIVKCFQCFKEGTLVETEEGLKPFEEIEVGDRVLAYDEETGAQAYKEVVRLFRNETKEWYHVRVNGEEIVCTGGHPFYVASLQEFRPARELKVGTELLLSSGECATIEAVQVERLEDPGTTYNFEVADYHTYFVSECSVLVHNVCATTSDSSDDVLDWSRKRSDGMTTEEHVRLHEVSNNTRKYHSVFNGDSVEITNKAWGMRGAGFADKGRILYDIPYANAGMTGGSAVAVPQVCNGVRIVIEGGTSNLLVTAYPIVL